MYDKTIKYYPEVKSIFNDYHKYLTGNEFSSRARAFDFIHDCNPGYQSEILYIMFNAGYEAALKKLGGTNNDN